MEIENWKEVQLQDVAKELTVGYVGTMTSEYVDSGIPFLRSKNVEPFGIKWDDMRYIGRDFHEKLNKSSLSPGDVVIVRTGKPGAAAVIPENLLEANCSDLVIIRPGSTLDARFIVYYLNSLGSHHINSHLVGAVQQHFNVGSARTLRLKLPPLSEQKAIAHILSSLDDKIELNRQMNETLEAMARAIFKSWFVDFDPVRAKMEGRQPAGMDAATADLFPDEFEESSLGLIPKEWKVKKLGDLAQNISRKFDFSKKTEVIFINTGDVLLGRFLHSNRISKEGLPGQAKKSICENDILMSEIRPANGRYAYVDFDSSDYVVSTKFMVIHALDEIEPRLLYRILILPVTLTELQVVAESRSGTFPQITFDSINYLPIILPPKTIQLAFLRIVSLLEEQIKLNDLQSNTLVTIRDTLLPKLMSGEIRVKEAEKIMENIP